MNNTRRAFFRKATLMGAAMSLSPLRRLVAAPRLSADPVDPEIVKELVGKAHKDLDRVKEILTEHPLILNASWDWGDGDFETAIGAAGHMGLRETAIYLLDKGARADIFVLTMLGETEIVKATIERYPGLLHASGPHGFTLLHHAQKGGEQALNLVDFLTEKGVTETFIDVFHKKG